MILFVAGASSDLARVRAFMARARSIGWTIAIDWTDPVTRLGANPPDRTIRENATDEIYRALRRSDAFVLLAPPNGVTTIGAWVELAWASEFLALDSVAISGEVHTIYSALGHVVANDDEAIAWLLALYTKEAA